MCKSEREEYNNNILYLTHTRNKRNKPRNKQQQHKKKAISKYKLKLLIFFLVANF